MRGASDFRVTLLGTGAPIPSIDRFGPSTLVEAGNVKLLIDAERVFQQTQPKLAAYTHLVFLSNPRVPPPTMADLIAETRRFYAGPLAVGQDLMCFEIGEQISIQ